MSLPPGWIHADTIYLSDHNSIMLPVRDIASPHLGAEPPATVRARTTEAEYVSNRRLIDAYLSIHDGRLDDLPLEGYTWGFPNVDKEVPTPALAQNEHSVSANRRRRMDRILLPSSYFQNLHECYCTFLGDRIIRRWWPVLPPTTARINTGSSDAPHLFLTALTLLLESIVNSRPSPWRDTHAGPMHFQTSEPVHTVLNANKQSTVCTGLS